MILLAVLLIAAIVLWRAADFIRRPHRHGDGTHVESYGFDLAGLTVPRSTLAASGMPRDGLPALDNPAVFTANDADAWGEQHRGKFLVPSDRVVGVVFDGHARAYPLRMLNWHEIVNDTLGGREIAVTYNPLCDSAVVFDRHVGGETLLFRFSGLLYNSNLIFYDQGGGEEVGEALEPSLWSQLRAEAIAGPAARPAPHQLDILPCALTTWEDWRRRFPGTEVLSPDPAFVDRYKRSPYVNYFGSDELRFPVDPLPPDDGRARKAGVIAVTVGGERRVFFISDLVEKAGGAGAIEIMIGGQRVRFEVIAEPPAAVATIASDARSGESSDSARDGTPAAASFPDEVVYSFWFAWYATHSDAPPPAAP